MTNPTKPGTKYTEQNVLNEARDADYGTIASQLYVENAGAGTSSRVNENNPVQVLLYDASGNPLVTTVGGQTGLKVHVVGDGDKYCYIFNAAGTTINPAQEDGNLASIKAKTDNIPALGQALAAGSVPVVLTAAQLSTLTPPAAANPTASTPYKNLDVDESGDLVVSGAKTLTGYFIHNKAATTLYVKLYDKASAPTVGTDTPVQVYGIPAGASANRECIMAFSLGIGIGATTGFADNDTGAPAANDIVVSLDYR